MWKTVGLRVAMRDECERDEREQGALGVAVADAERRHQQGKQESQPDRQGAAHQRVRRLRAPAASRVCAAPTTSRRPQSRTARHISAAAATISSTASACSSRRCGEQQRLGGDERHGDAAPAQRGHAEAQRHHDPDDAAVHPAPSTRRVITASRATPAPAPSNRGTSRMRSFATSVSSTPRPMARAPTSDGKQRETCAEPGRMRQGRSPPQARARASGVQPWPTEEARGRGRRTRAAAPRGSS